MKARGLFKTLFPLLFFFPIIFLFGCAGFGCASDDGFKDTFKTYDCFSVNFIDVGEGDAIFVNFNDGNAMLIDCGEKSDRNYAAIARYLDAYAKDGLTYMVLTHPDGDHIGNAAEILKNYSVKTAFVPDLPRPEEFGRYYDAYRLIKDGETAGGTTAEYSAVLKSFFGEDYYMIMLSPNAKDTTDSAYDEFNSYEDPPADARNDLSPIIYLDYKGVRFVFTGDAGFSQERVALDNTEGTGIVNRYLKNKGKSPVNLNGVDFLKVSHHGANDASGNEFIDALAPKNAVISVGGDNRYGHPAKETVDRILNANAECNIYLTSECGTVNVLVDGFGAVTVETAASIAADAA